MITLLSFKKKYRLKTHKSWQLHTNQLYKGLCEEREREREKLYLQSQRL